MKLCTGFTLVRVGPRRIFSVGGYYGQSFPKNGRNTLIPHAITGVPKLHTEDIQVIWKGDLSEDGYHMSWNKIILGLSPIRVDPICFKLKNNVYIASTYSYISPDEPNVCTFCFCFSCDRYNLVDENFYPNVFSYTPSLAFYLPNYCEPTTATDENETFAILAFYGKMDHKEIILMFTEDNGFEKLNNLNSPRCSGKSTNRKSVMIRVE